jgi:hypothetical protein
MGAKVRRGSENPHFKSKYANIQAVVETAHDLLDELGLYVFQAVHGDVLYTEIGDPETGASVGCEYQLTAAKTDPQAYAGAVTYARRYGLKVLLGMLDTDDDGETAQGRGKLNPAPVDPQKAINEAGALLDRMGAVTREQKAAVASMLGGTPTTPAAWDKFVIRLSEMATSGWTIEKMTQEEV